MSRKKLWLLSCLIWFVSILCIGSILSIISAASVTETEGIPTPFHFVSVQQDQGDHIIVYRSGHLALCQEDAVWLMNDAVLPGQTGQHGDVQWVHVPDGRTASIFPGHLTDAIPTIPLWVQNAETFHLEHPDVEIVAQNQYPGKMVDGEFVLTPGGYQEMIAPRQECIAEAANVLEPTVIEYRCRLSGDISDLTFPPVINHCLYRVLP